MAFRHMAALRASPPSNSGVIDIARIKEFMYRRAIIKRADGADRNAVLPE